MFVECGEGLRLVGSFWFLVFGLEVELVGSWLEVEEKRELEMEVELISAWHYTISKLNMEVCLELRSTDILPTVQNKSSQLTKQLV